MIEEGERPFRRAVAAVRLKPEGSLIRAAAVRVASGPDKGGTCRDYQTVRACPARPEGVTRVNQCLTLRNSEAGSNLVDMGRCAAHHSGPLVAGVDSEAV